MFRCHFCNQVTPPGTKKHNVVIATREKTYPSRRSESKRGGGRFRPRNDSHGDGGGKGVETTQEVPACPACATKQESVDPVMVAEELAPVVDAVAETSAATETAATAETATETAATTETAAAPEAAAATETPAEAPAAAEKASSEPAGS